MEKDDRRDGGSEKSAGSREQQRSPSGSRPAPGKVTRTSKLSSGGGLAVQRKAAAPAPEAAGSQARSSWELTMDPWMDAAHRGSTALVQRQAAPGGADTDASRDALAAAQSDAGQPLHEGVRSKVETATGQDLSGVRVHTGSSSVEAARAVSARAYTVGQDIHFGAGEYRPGTDEGDRLISHELVHTVQQRASGAGLAQTKLTISNPSDAAEVEADRLAPAAARGEPVSISAAPSAGVHLEGTGTPAPAPTPTPTTTPTTGGETGATPTPSLEQQITEALGRNDENALRALATDQARISEIIRVCLAQNRGALLISLPAGAQGAQWNLAMTEDQYTQAIGQAPANIQRQDQYNGVWILYGNGDRRSGAAARTTFERLYTARILAPGSTAVFWPLGTNSSGGTTWEWRDIYMPVNPDDNTMKGLMTGVRTLPQGQVNIANIAFVAQKQTQYKETAPTAGAWTNHGAAAAISTSYYLDNCNSIVIQSDTAGSSAGNMTAIGQTGGGTAVAVGGATGGPALTFFLNHARHEVGHAVGARKLDGTSEPGDDFAKTYGGWAASSKSDLKTSTWTASGTTEVTISGTKHNLAADAVADWLAGCIENEAEPAGNAVTAIAANAAAKLAGIAAAFPGQALVQYFQAIFGSAGSALAGLKNVAYMYPGYTPAADPIIWSSRCNPAGWWKYSKAAHDALRASHGWYSMASWKEMFAEIYTHRYSGGAFPAAANGKDPQAFFRELEASRDSGLIPSEAAAGQAMASTTPAPAPTPTPTGPAPTPPPAPAPTPLPTSTGGG